MEHDDLAIEFVQGLLQNGDQDLLLNAAFELLEMAPNDGRAAKNLNAAFGEFVKEKIAAAKKAAYDCDAGEAQAEANAKLMDAPWDLERAA